MAKQLTKMQRDIMAKIMQIKEVAGCTQDFEHSGYFYIYSYYERNYMDFITMLDHLQSELTAVLGHEVSRDTITLHPQPHLAEPGGIYIAWLVGFDA